MDRPKRAGVVRGGGIQAWPTARQLECSHPDAAWPEPSVPHAAVCVARLCLEPTQAGLRGTAGAELHDLEASCTGSGGLHARPARWAASGHR